MTKKRLLATLSLLALTACTPGQHQAWLDWFNHDPDAAIHWAVNECGPLCTDDWDHDGQVEPDVGATERNGNPESTMNNGVFQPHGIWDALAECESGGDWHIATGNGYYGGLQFVLSSWQATGGGGYPHHASREEQIHRAEILLDMQGWDAWPTCSRIIGVR